MSTRLVRLGSAAVVAVAIVVFQTPAGRAVPVDTTADVVFGQPNTTSNVCNNGGLSASSLCSPLASAVDSAGNLYIADFNNSRVLEYDSPLTTDLIADRVYGQPNMTSNGCNNGGIGADTLCFPKGVALDGAGRLWVSDSTNNRVLEYDAPLTDATADRVFGQPDIVSNSCTSAGASTLCDPAGLALDNAGNLYVADGKNNRVLEYDSPLTDAIADRVYGQPSLTSTNACLFGGADRLCMPFGVAIDGAGNLFVSDAGRARVLEYDAPLADSIADEVFGQADMLSIGCNNGGISASSLCQPVGVAVDQAGTLYVADSFNERVLEYNSALTTDRIADRVFGQPDFVSFGCNTGGIGAGTLCGSYGVTVDAAGNLYLADHLNHRVLRFKAISPLFSGDRTIGQPSPLVNQCNQGGAPGASTLCLPYEAVVDAAGNLYVSDSGNNRVLEYDSPLTTDLVADRVFGQPDFVSGTCNNGGLSASALCNPNGLALDAAGNLYVGDQNNHRVLRYDSPLTNAVADRVYGQSGFFDNGCNDGGIGNGTLCNPVGVAVDLFGNLYVADFGNSRVLEYDEPLVSALADRVYGQASMFGSGCNSGGISALTFCNPIGVATDQGGDLYVSDHNNHRVMKYDAPLAAPAVVQTIGQTSTSAGTCNQGGSPAAATLCNPSGVDIDPTGVLHIADQANHRVLADYGAAALGAAATQVYGQGGEFTTNTVNQGGLSALSLNTPTGLAFDSGRNLYVADYNNNRVIEYEYCLSPVDCDDDGILDTTDNCDTNPDPSQTNTDGLPLDNGPNLAGDDATIVNGGDAMGDPCDPDDDNDGVTDAIELNLPNPGCTSATAPTNPLDMDSDGDHLTDGWECANGADPADATSKFLGAVLGDNDGDNIEDLWELRGYNGSGGTTDVDGDGCWDMVEIGSVDGNLQVGIADRLAVARRSLNIAPYNVPNAPQDYVFDIDKNGSVGIADRLFVARASLLGPPWEPKSCP